MTAIFSRASLDSNHLSLSLAGSIHAKQPKIPQPFLSKKNSLRMMNEAPPTFLSLSSGHHQDSSRLLLAFGHVSQPGDDALVPSDALHKRFFIQILVVVMQ